MGYVIGLGISALIALLVWAAVAEQTQWDAFSKAHDCKVVGKISSTSTTAVGFGTNGQVSITPIYVPGKTGYACTDGVTYWR